MIMKRIMFLTFILLSTIAFSATYSSITSGDWNIVGTWNNSIPVDANNNIVTISAGHTVTATNLIFNNRFTINIESSATLIIYANPVDGDAITVKNNLTLNIADGGLIIISGNFKVNC